MFVEHIMKFHQHSCSAAPQSVQSRCTSFGEAASLLYELLVTAKAPVCRDSRWERSRSSIWYWSALFVARHSTINVSGCSILTFVKTALICAHCCLITVTFFAPWECSNFWSMCHASMKSRRGSFLCTRNTPSGVSPKFFCFRCFTKCPPPPCASQQWI